MLAKLNNLIHPELIFLTKRRKCDINHPNAPTISNPCIFRSYIVDPLARKLHIALQQAQFCGRMKAVT